MIEELTSLENLIIAECDLVSLDNLPDCPQLLELDISSNAIKDEDLKILAKYPKLTKLNIADNKIAKLDTIKCLKNHKKL
jgi:Leucine-rich repeat (LRR) protein